MLNNKTDNIHKNMRLLISNHPLHLTLLIEHCNRPVTYSCTHVFTNLIYFPGKPWWQTPCSHTFGLFQQLQGTCIISPVVLKNLSNSYFYFCIFLEIIILIRTNHFLKIAFYLKKKKSKKIYSIKYLIVLDTIRARK